MLYVSTNRDGIVRCSLSRADVSITACTPNVFSTSGSGRGMAVYPNYLLRLQNRSLLRCGPIGSAAANCTSMISFSVGTFYEVTPRGDKVYIPDQDSASVTLCNYNDSAATASAAISGCTSLASASFNNPTQVTII